MIGSPALECAKCCVRAMLNIEGLFVDFSGLELALELSFGDAISLLSIGEWTLLLLLLLLSLSLGDVGVLVLLGDEGGVVTSLVSSGNFNESLRFGDVWMVNLFGDAGGVAIEVLSGSDIARGL